MKNFIDDSDGETTSNNSESTGSNEDNDVKSGDETKQQPKITRSTRNNPNNGDNQIKTNLFLFLYLSRIPIQP